MKSKYILIIALIMAIVTTVLFRQYLINMDKKVKAAEQIITMVVPKVDIAKNQLVKEDMLELKEFSAGSVNADALKKISDVAGKYATTDIKSGEILYSFRFTDQYSETQVITRKIRDGARALSIEVSDMKAVSKLIQPENFVDVVSTVNGQTNIIVENVRILAVGKRLSDTVPTTTNADKSAIEDYGTVTLELWPNDVIKVVNADEMGNVKLILRGQLVP